MILAVFYRVKYMKMENDKEWEEEEVNRSRIQVSHIFDQTKEVSAWI